MVIVIDWDAMEGQAAADQFQMARHSNNHHDFQREGSLKELGTENSSVLTNRLLTSTVKASAVQSKGHGERGCIHGYRQRQFRNL